MKTFLRLCSEEKSLSTAAQRGQKSIGRCGAIEKIERFDSIPVSWLEGVKVETSSGAAEEEGESAVAGGRWGGR